MVKDNQITLHFTFSPVQGFVSQARRTRDLWAASYLLSWLAGKAMEAILDQGGEIVLPNVESDPLFQQIRSPAPVTLADRATYLGSLPNRFTAIMAAPLDGTLCTDALNKAWQQVVDEVYSVVKNSFSTNQEKLWQRQTEHFWECTWVIGEATHLLDRRKNLRLHSPSPEEGEKCTVCGERQELSCEKFPNREKIKRWWKNLQQKTPEEQIHGLDFKKNERLCSICLIKRIFPHVSSDAIGWQVPELYPSTNYMSAVDWIIYVLELAGNHGEIKTAAATFLETVQDAIVAKAEKRTWHHIRKINELATRITKLEKFLYIDGSVFFKDAIFQDDLKLKNRKEVANALAALQKTVAEITPEFAEASPFYAMLLMDGDNMGTIISDQSAKERKLISLALSHFTSEIPDIIHTMNGMLLYAGGDDVFALVPVSTALECARRCRLAYQCAFQKHAPFISSDHATISAAIEYAHMNTALGVVVRDIHRLLDGVAKDETGRDAVACRVWKRGGPVLTWSRPWEKIDDGLLVSVVQQDFTDETGKPDHFSSKFFYKLGDIFKLINSENFHARPQDIKDLLVTEYLTNREHNWPDDISKQEILHIAGNRIEHLLQLCLEHHRSVNGDGKPSITPTGRYSTAGALLVRFLTQKEV